MTMLAAWLDEECVALAADSKMTDCDSAVTKLHIVDPSRVTFGVSFGHGAYEWLVQYPCACRNPYPEHWRDCSCARNTTDLERTIANDLRTGRFPDEANLELWLAGLNASGRLEAFAIDGTGRRVRHLGEGCVAFNKTSTNCGFNPFERFVHHKRELDHADTAHAGAHALQQTCAELVSYCDQIGHPSIGGQLQFHKITI